MKDSQAGAFLLGVLAGAGAGMIVGFLTSPYQGTTTRNLIASQWRHYLAEARKAARRAESKSRDLRNRAKGLAHDLQAATIGAGHPNAEVPMP